VSPVNFDPGGAQATVSFGSATTAKISFTADDPSCMWNDFPVAIVCCDLDCDNFTPQNPAPTSSINDWITAIGIGQQTPPESDWPLLRVYDWREAILCGYRFTGRMQFFDVAGSGTFRIGNTLGAGSGYIFPTLVTGGQQVDTGWQDLIGPDCSQVPCTAPDVVEWGLVWSNFSPFINCRIANGRFEGAWTLGLTAQAEFISCQQYEIIFNPPCHPDEGLIIRLPTNDCGIVGKTYTQIKNDVNALNLGITAAVLGGHGADTAEPDPNSTIFPDCSSLFGALYGKPMTGATCTGGTDYREGMETP
jgi:hypothetical protein